MSTRPAPVVLETQYDWKAVYAPVIQKLAGFNAHDSTPLRAFQFSEKNGIVSLKFKVDPCHEHWLGQQNAAGAPGFVLLKRNAT